MRQGRAARRRGRSEGGGFGRVPSEGTSRRKRRRLCKRRRVRRCAVEAEQVYLTILAGNEEAEEEEALESRAAVSARETSATVLDEIQRSGAGLLEYTPRASVEEIGAQTTNLYKYLDQRFSDRY